MPFRYSGLVLPFNHYHLLVYGPHAEALGAPLFGPPAYLSPGYRYFASAEYLLPRQVVDDIGQVFLPPDCYEWIEARGDVFPRADIIGVTPAGEKRHAVIKELDLVEMAVFATARPADGAAIQLDLALDLGAAPDRFALAPAGLPLALFSRALPCYRLAPDTLGAVSAAIVMHLLASRRRDWRLTFDDLDDLLPDA